MPRVPYVPPKLKLHIDWTIDELVLALELHLNDYRGKSGDEKHPKVRELSKLLNELAAVLGVRRGEDYRNGDGVAMKLLSFNSIDPTKTV